MTDSSPYFDEDATARQLLKKAYVWLNFGYYQKAMIACEEAGKRAEDPLVPETLRGAILTASGRPEEAMRHLMRLHRRHRDAILTTLYLAEACFLAGRNRRAWKILDSLDDKELADSRWRNFALQLRRTWEQLDDAGPSPEPVTVPLGASPERTGEQL